MSPRRELADLSAVELRTLVAKREVSPVEVVEACLERLQRHNPTINAGVTLNPRALDDAPDLGRRLARGGTPRPPCGVPLGGQGATPGPGLRPNVGPPPHKDYIPQGDAPRVYR